ncbi:MAG TPA: SpoIIE family protein phosphatase [Thermoanaerobaculia bacterium]|nr:SpoIIE family protein phosphatase [Thermoanaerobaculia bacterium]
MDLLETPPPAEVTILTPLSNPAKLSLPANPVSIGRASDCTIPIRDRYLSRKHAEIVPEAGAWILKDCGSANGTYVNGTRVESELVLHPGDRIRLGDTEIVFETESSETSTISVADSIVSPTIAIPYGDIVDTQPGTAVDLDRLRILNALATELIEERPLDQLFGFIVDRIMEYLSPSRVAIALLERDGTTFRLLEVRRLHADDDGDLTISRTLLREVVEEKKVLAYVDTSADKKLSTAKSIVMQQIRSALVAPVTIGGSVAGVLYLDYQQTLRMISDEDVHLVGQIARLASIKLETTRLREESIEKRLMEEELRTAASIQQRLLPTSPPDVPGYRLAGSNRACRTVSGDYFDFIVEESGRLWFAIGDVAGKGVTAALIMSSLQTAFRIFVKERESAAKLTARLNAALHETIPSTKFVTLVVGILDPATGTIKFANAGHTPPIHVRSDSRTELRVTDLVLGLFPQATYRDQELHLDPGDALVIFTDGAIECTSPSGDELGGEGVLAAVGSSWGMPADEIEENLREFVIAHAGSAEELGDDLTFVVISRDPARAGSPRSE